MCQSRHQPPVFFVWSLKSECARSQAEAILLNSIGADYLPLDEVWPMWPLTEDSTRIMCRLRTLDGIESAMDGGGERVTLFGGEMYQEDMHREVIRAAMNSVEIEFDQPISPREGAFFLSPFQGWKACRREAILQLRVTNVSELPDFHSYLAFHRDFERQGVFPFLGNLESRSSKVLGVASSCKVALCSWIPFGTDATGSNCGAVEVLRTDGTQRIHAILHYPSTVPTPKTGTLIIRECKWNEQECERQARVEIAQVVKVLS